MRSFSAGAGIPVSDSYSQAMVMRWGYSWRRTPSGVVDRQRTTTGLFCASCAVATVQSSEGVSSTVREAERARRSLCSIVVSSRGFSGSIPIRRTLVTHPHAEQQVGRQPTSFPSLGKEIYPLRTPPAHLVREGAGHDP